MYFRKESKVPLYFAKPQKNNLGLIKNIIFPFLYCKVRKVSKLFKIGLPFLILSDGN